MIERVIENWLTNTNERGYEIPFCQLLTSKGYKVVHLSAHGAMEQGKDVIAIAPNGIPCAYQLKSGNINQTTWRRIRPQIEELIEIPPQHPAVKKRAKHRAFLVTNGLLSDPVRREIDDRNKEWHRRGYPTLETKVKGELLTEFLKIHGHFLPMEPNDFRRFLELFLDEGRGLLPKEKVSEFLLSVLPFEKNRQHKKLKVNRAISSAVLLMSYILWPYQNQQNHLSLIDGWVLLATHILGIAECFGLAKKYWRNSFDLALYGVKESFKNLKEEVFARAHFIEGDVIVDGPPIYQTRMTLLLGYLTAFDLYLKMKDPTRKLDDKIIKFIDEHKNDLFFWGESTMPLFLSIAWHLEIRGRQAEAESLLIELVKTLVKQNNPRSERGLPNPYYNAESAIRIFLGLNEKGLPEKNFAGHSYSLRTLVELLARRLRRQALALWWREITKIRYCEFIPRPLWATYLWRAKYGELKQRLPTKTQSWKKLLSEVRKRDTREVPKKLCNMPDFLLIFLLVYPHRLRPQFVKVVEDALHNTARR